jgi:hypothetical protein
MKYLSLVFFTFVLWNCTPPTASIDLEAEQAALTTAAQSYYQLMNDHNWEGLEAIYSPSGQAHPRPRRHHYQRRSRHSKASWTALSPASILKCSYEDLAVRHGRQPRYGVLCSKRHHHLPGQPRQ